MINFNVIKSIESAIMEDLGGTFDITSNFLPASSESGFQIIAKTDMVFCGVEIINAIFNHPTFIFNLDKKPEFNINFNDGQYINSGEIIIKGRANIRFLMQIERVILNYIQHMSGVATATSNFIKKLTDEISNEKNKKILDKENLPFLKTKITDTRKTIPNMRYFQKYAVKCGGGSNHRFGLNDCIMLKDNHIEAFGGIESALTEIFNKKPHYISVIVECDTLEQVEIALKFPCHILLDNMRIEDIIKARILRKNLNKNNIFEASGGVNINNISTYNGLVEYVSIGALTHSFSACDISLDIIR